MKNEKTTKNQSKFLSLILRHNPQTIGVELDEAGWIGGDTLLTALQSHPAGRSIDRNRLHAVVADNDKQRFEFSEDGLQIRARQGHSVNVDLGYEAAIPPETLFHGTPEKFVESIRESGLKKMKRHHVHLHIDSETSNDVGARRGKPVLLTIRAAAMHQNGHEFFVTENNVWLTDNVPVKYIDFPDSSIDINAKETTNESK